MSRKNYYYLVAGLKEYALDAEAKGFDIHAIVGEIKENLSSRDRRSVELLYDYYDIENIVSIRAGRNRFSLLGNLSREELVEELAVPSHLPAFIANTVRAYDLAAAGNESDDIDAGTPLEHALLIEWYDQCAHSKSRFLRQWAEFDRTLRNVSAAFSARRLNIPVADVVVGTGDIESALVRSSAADFGIRGEVAWMDQLVAAMSEGINIVDKEHRIDSIRWNMADELSAMNYFDIDFILAYLVKINLIYRWTSLDPEQGRQLLHKLIGELTAVPALS